MLCPGPQMNPLSVVLLPPDDAVRASSYLVVEIECGLCAVHCALCIVALGARDGQRLDKAEQLMAHHHPFIRLFGSHPFCPPSTSKPPTSTSSTLQSPDLPPILTHLNSAFSIISTSITISISHLHHLISHPCSPLRHARRLGICVYSRNGHCPDDITMRRLLS